MVRSRAADTRGGRRSVSDVFAHRRGAAADCRLAAHASSGRAEGGARGGGSSARPNSIESVAANNKERNRICLLLLPSNHLPNCSFKPSTHISAPKLSKPESSSACSPRSVKATRPPLRSRSVVRHLNEECAFFATFSQSTAC